jgi:hypothetical protein
MSQGPYNNFSVLQLEGQVSQSDLAMLAVTNTSIVFEADLSPLLSNSGDGWQITLAAATQVGTGTIQIEFSTDAQSWSSAGTVNVTTNAISASSAVQAAASDHAFFRLTLSPTVMIDNVGITANLIPQVPEPSVAALLAVGLLGLGHLGRRRRRA